MKQFPLGCLLLVCTLSTGLFAQDCAIAGAQNVECGSVNAYTGSIPVAVNPYSSSFSLLSNTAAASFVGSSTCGPGFGCTVMVNAGHLGSFILKVTHTTQAGAMIMCQITVTVTDTTPPIITCPPDVSIPCNSPTGPAATGMPTAVDCGPVIFTHLDAAGATNCAGTAIVRTWTATDLGGNTATCVQNITFVDTTLPTVTCPPPVTVQCDSQIPPANPGSVTTSDNCGGLVAVIHVSDVPSGSCPKTITRTYQGTDPCGNTQTCTQIITVNDTTPPVITCPPDMSATAGPSGCVVLNIGIATATDNCTGAVTVTNNAPIQFCTGMTSVTWTATDPCGNVATCKQNITVGGGTICATKFYDENANGVQDPGEPGIQGWLILVTGDATLSGLTDSSGTVCFTAGAGNYVVSEGTPGEANWVHTTPTSVPVTLGTSASVSFGNYCFDDPSGGHTLGFWRNPNGKAILQANDPAWRTLLNSLNLRNADGSDFTVPGGSFNSAFDAFKTWNQGATATNMTYMLSAQLAATVLSANYWTLDDSQKIVFPGSLSVNGVCVVPFLSVAQPISCGAPPLLSLTAGSPVSGCGCSSNNGVVLISDLIARADCLLGSYPVATAAGTVRTYEDGVKSLLDIINNNGGGGYSCGAGAHVIHSASAGICPFSFPK